MTRTEGGGGRQRGRGSKGGQLACKLYMHVMQDARRFGCVFFSIISSSLVYNGH
eukprot:COSAG02_NODE_4437_length_5358_cov_3.520251_2_plen_54_part_00